MKIVNRSPESTADISSAKGTAFKELRWLLLVITLLVVGIYLVIGFVVDMAVVHISFETEAAFFESMNASDVAWGKDDEELRRLDGILEKLTADPSVPPLKYRLQIVEAEEPNAFAFPGGTIGVTRGLLGALKEDEELAFVLAHELGHFQNRDHLRGVGRAVGAGVVFALLFGGEMGSGSTGNLYHHVLHRGYSRNQEEAADRFGVSLVRRVYGNTDGVDRLFQIISDSDELPEWAYMFATHPSPEDRIRDLKAYAEEAE